MKSTFWDKIAQNYDKSIRNHGVSYDKTMNASRSWLSDVDRVLDFGCGPGEHSLDFASLVQQVHGIDLSVKMVTLAKQKAQDRQADNVRFDHIDVFNGGLTGTSFSAIAAFNILHLVNDLPQVLARLNDLLTEDGLLISETPCLGEKGVVIRALIDLSQKLRIVPLILSLKVAELKTHIREKHFEIIDTQMWDKNTATYWIIARKKSR